MHLIERQDGVLLGSILGIGSLIYIALYARITWATLIDPPSWFGWINLVVVMGYFVGSFLIVIHEADKLSPYRPMLAKRAFYTFLVFYAVACLTMLTMILRKRRKTG